MSSSSSLTSSMLSQQQRYSLPPTTLAPAATSASSSSDNKNNPLNLDAADFDCEAYLSHLLKRTSLDELLKVEESMIHDVRRLDVEMQTLVYENYNKFISATGTVRQMRTELLEMNDAMRALADSMNNISTLSQRLSSALSTQRDTVCKLARANRTVKSLQFLFDLPQKLQTMVDAKDAKSAVAAFVSARTILHRYKHVPSVANIYSECMVVIDQLRDQLTHCLRARVISAEQVTNAVSLLMQLDAPAKMLATELLNSAQTNLHAELDHLESLIRPQIGDDATPQPFATDVLEFVDAGCSSFFVNLSVFASVYSQLFTRACDVDERDMVELCDRLVARCLQLAERRFLLETDPAEFAIVVRAVDRFYRRICATEKMLNCIDYAQPTLALVMKVAEHQIHLSHARLVDALHASIKRVRSQLAVGQKEQQTTSYLSEMVAKLEQSLLHELKTALANLLLFTASDVTLASVDDSLFATPFGRIVHERLVVAFFAQVVVVGEEFCRGRDDKAHVNSTLILVLSRFCKNLESTSAVYMLDLCEQQFRISPGNELTTADYVTERLAKVAQNLLDHYVQMEGVALSQLLVKSVESRDWLECAEPRSVRAVMKRIVEDLSSIDERVGQLFDEGNRKDRGAIGTGNSIDSNRIRRPQAIKMAPRTVTASNSTISSTLDKLWTERVDYFAKVQFNKVSVMTGIVKICLKTLLECVRLRTFGKYGLQQVQVDCHYLQLYLWRFVYDEHLVLCLLDEIISSVVHRCTDPHQSLMEANAVHLLCERG